MRTLTHRMMLGAVLTAAIVAPAALHAQDFDAKTAAHVKAAYMNDLDTLHAKFVALANAIPADKYTWRPTAGVRSISEVFMHVANEFYFYVPMSVGGKAPADFGSPKDAMPKNEKITAKADVIAQLEKSWAHTRAEMAAADPAKMTGTYGQFKMTVDAAGFVMTGDLHEHLGQLIAYARSVGVKPPWSK
jgi:uncharacterized damage-inducible protein DinB